LAFASDFAFAVLKSAGHDGPLLYRGPCAAVSRGRQAAQRASAWMPMPFRQHMDVLSKSPAPTHGLAGQDARQAPSGVGFSFGYFSLGHAREK
jgi:hypothetical protein